MARVSAVHRDDVLKYIDSLHFRTQYIKITILDHMDGPLRAIEGRATGGSININGSSAVRRTGSLTLVTELIEDPESPLDIMYEVTNIKSLISINKRVKIEIGIENSGKQFLEQKIFWISLGVFAISNASVTHNASNGITIQLKLTDKMAFLNGDLGGVFTTNITHSPSGYVIDGTQAIGMHGTDTVMITEGVKVRTLVNYLLADFAELHGFEYNIEDIPETIRNMIRWIHPTHNLSIKEGALSLTKRTKAEAEENERIFAYGEVIGYTETDFVFPLDKDLVSKAGESITSALDQIKNALGNYEYFFDIDGVFHFREIRNLLNEGSSIDDLTKAIAEKYFFNVDKTEPVYSFKDEALITSYNNNPQYTLVKNDFSVWGQAPTTELPIWYHLVLQAAPDAEEYLGWKIRVDDKGDVKTVELCTDALQYPLFINPTSAGNKEEFYLNFSADDRPGRENSSKDDDWRLRLYLIAKAKYESTRTPFDRELIDHIPDLYNLKIVDGDTNEFFAPIYDRNSPSFSYWLDIINTNDVNLMATVDVKHFGVETIGRRPKTLNDEDVNCLFMSHSDDIEDFNYFESNEYANEGSTWYLPTDYIITGDGVDAMFWTNCVSLGTVEKSAYDLLRSSLHEYLSYNNNINIQSMPVYHLDANQRITVDNTESDIHGDYVIDSITLPLDLGGMMTINARKAIERI